MNRFTFLAILLVPCLALAESLPYTNFGHLPVIDQPSVSPDGEHVAAVLNGADGPTVVVSQFASRELQGVVRLKYGDHRIDWITWANNERLLVSVSESSGQGTEKYRVPRLYQVGLDGKDMKQIRRRITGKEMERLTEWQKKLPTNNIISLLPQDPEHILMQVWDEWDNAFAVYKVNIEKNKFKKLFPNTYDVWTWRADGKGNIVYGWEYNVNTNEYVYWHRPVGEKKWQKLHSRKAYGDESFWPMHIDGTKAIVRSDRELGRESVWRYDIVTGEYEELLFAADNHDVAGAILSNDRSELLGVYYYDHFRKDHYFDNEADKKAQFVKASFPHHATSIVSRSLDENRMIVSIVRDNEPRKYVWVDLATKAAGLWFSQYPYLDGKQLPTVTPIEFEARDGMTITGYLTMPLQWEGDKPSLIVHPHGGPSGRDYRYFNPWVQFFANRGHAVLQVNFRGSEGFGTEFLQAGWRQWGQAMQEDVYDAVEWLQEQELVDTDRKCVVGASYGGYVSLVAAYQNPDEYRCIASIAGIANLYELAKLDSLYRSRKEFIGMEVGDPSDSGDKKMLMENSAINHVGAIKAPLLVIHGTEDTRVRIKQTRDFFRKASEAGIDIEYLELEDGTHFLDEYNNRLAVFEALDSFLQQHL